MCGIVGFLTEERGKGQSSREAFLEQGLIIDILRGEDSTGVMYGHHDARKEGHCGYAKDAVDGYTFINMPGYKDIVRTMHTMRFIVGHNRSATVGNISIATAHPFQSGLVTGVHNGTVRGGMLNLPIPMAKSKAKVDSECLIMNLAHVDPGDASKEVLAKIDGAYMLVWYDGRDHTLNFARNDTRTFHFAQSYDQDTLYFASESGQLQWLGERNCLSIADVVYMRPGKHLKFKQGSLEPEVTGYEPAPKYMTATKTTHRTVSGGEWGRPGRHVPKIMAPLMGDNKILVGGIKRDIPQKLQEDLLDMELAVEDRLCFTPIEAQPEVFVKNRNSRRYVLGYLDSLSATALIYNVEAHVIDNGFGRRWTVRPIGVQYTDREQTVPIVVCELVAAVNQTETLTLRALREQVSSTSSTQDEPTQIGGYRGPEGLFVSKADWIGMTEDGCISCGQALMLVDSPDIEWQGEDPRCLDCTAIMHQEMVVGLENEYFDNNYDPTLH